MEERAGIAFTPFTAHFGKAFLAFHVNVVLCVSFPIFGLTHSAIKGQERGTESGDFYTLGVRRALSRLPARFPRSPTARTSSTRSSSARSSACAAKETKTTLCEEEVDEEKNRERAGRASAKGKEIRAAKNRVRRADQAARRAGPSDASGLRAVIGESVDITLLKRKGKVFSSRTL